MRGDRSGPEWVSPEGLRVDGRRPAELRRMKVSLGFLSNTSGSGSNAAADGSARVDAGNTKVRAFWGILKLRFIKKQVCSIDLCMQI
mgnify:CR=1 FL=1